MHDTTVPILTTRIRGNRITGKPRPSKPAFAILIPVDALEEDIASTMSFIEQLGYRVERLSDPLQCELTSGAVPGSASCVLVGYNQEGEQDDQGHIPT